MDRVREMEEKHEAIMNAVVSNNQIPDDLAYSILLKLPLKSLKRFGNVCKSWSHLFENPHFMRIYSNNSTHTSLLLKVHLSQSLMYLLSGERFETRVRLDFPPLLDCFCFIIFRSSVNYSLCLEFAHNRVVLWNPFIKEFKIVPPSSIEFESPYREPEPYYKRFGYDHVRDDYKVIRYLQFCLPCYGPYNMKNLSLEPLLEIYSLRSDSWKQLDYKITSHWDVSCLVSFDLSNEVFFTTPMPLYMGDVSYMVHVSCLVEINGYVALISNYPEKTTIEVSILGEIDVKESWTKLFIIGPLPCVVNIIGVGKKGDIFFQNNDDGLAWFDWSTGMIVDRGLKVRSCQIVTYKENFESLISVGFEKCD